MSGKQNKDYTRKVSVRLSVSVFPVRKGNLGLGHGGRPFGGEGFSAGWLLLVPAHSAVCLSVHGIMGTQGRRRAQDHDRWKTMLLTGWWFYVLLAATAVRAESSKLELGEYYRTDMI